jgi:hypothetical protein
MQESDTITRDTRDGGDDEQEYQFLGIPIAGENEGDSDEDWYEEDIEEEEDEDKEYLFGLINNDASNDIAFRVEPNKDGIIMSYQTDPIPLHPNQYRILTEEEPYDSTTSLFQPKPPSSRLTQFIRVTNAQRLANPSKLAKQKGKQQIRQTLKKFIDLQVEYITNPSQTHPPILTPPHTTIGGPNSASTANPNDASKTTHQSYTNVWTQR